MTKGERSSGAIVAALAVLGTPIALTQLGVMTMHMVDTSILGHRSVDDLAAGGLARSIAMAVSMVGFGVCAALDPIASQALGAGDPTRAWSAYRTNLRAALLVSVPVVSTALVVISLLGVFGIEPEVARLARLYLLGLAPGLAATFAYHSTRNFLQAHGDTRRTLAGMALANLVNIPLCGFLVHGDTALEFVGLPRIGFSGLGALGAGLAYSGAYTLQLAVTVTRLPRYRLPPSPPAVSLSTMFRLGLPIGLQWLAEVAVYSAMAVFAGRLGTKVVAAHQIASSYASTTFMFVLGIAGATAILVGRAVGAGSNPRRIGLLGVALGAALMGLGGAAFALFPAALASPFTTDAEVTTRAVGLLRVVAVFQLFDGVGTVAAAALRGTADVRFPFVACVLSYWLIAFPLALVFGLVLGLGAAGFWWGLTAGIVVNAVLLTWRFWVRTRALISRV
jgi:MATE family multidrug resistance protein